MGEFIDTNGSDRIAGTGAADTIYGLGGNDELLGLAGNDTIYGDGRAPPVVFPGLHLAARLSPGLIGVPEPFGNDVIDGGAGNDTIDAGDGNDHVQGTGTVDGDAGDDDLHGYDATVLRGGLGHDHVHCGLGFQRVDFDAVTEDEPSAPSPLFANEIVFDFQHADGDPFDVSTIDADETQNGNQAFDHVAAGLIDQAGELGIRVIGGVTYVVGGTNGIGGAGFQVQIASGSTIMAWDIVL